MFSLALALILGGAIGNLVDRLVLGHVTDFLLFYQGGWAFPAFNLADCAITLGAILLIWTGIASWKTMFSVFVGGALTALMFNAFGIEGNAMANMPWYEHLALGGFCFGAVFMATDPVTSARTEKGKWIYGLLIGFLAICIRVLNPGYPEGMMLAILMMNIFAPLIDYYVVDANIKRRNNRVKPIAK